MLQLGQSHFFLLPPREAVHDANKAIVVKTEFNKGPMNGDLIAFANIDSSNHYLQFSKAEVVNWKTLLE